MKADDRFKSLHPRLVCASVFVVCLLFLALADFESPPYWWSSEPTLDYVTESSSSFISGKLNVSGDLSAIL